MAYRVPTSQLPELAEWLKQFLPDSARAFHLALSNIRGLEEDEFWSNKWPDITTVLVKLPHKDGQKFCDNNNSMTLYTTDYNSCRALLLSVVDWTGALSFQAVHLLAKNCIDDICREKGVRVTIEDSAVAQFTKADKPGQMYSLEEGFTLENLSEEDAGVICSHWKYAENYATDYISHFIRTYPSAGIRDSQQALVGWVVVDRSWSPAMLHVKPEFRRKGFATALYSHVTKAILEEGIVPIARIETDNKVSFEVHRKCGFHITRESGIFYVTSFPKWQLTVE